MANDYERNKDYYAIHAKAWALSNPDKAKEIKRNYYYRHREEQSAYAKAKLAKDYVPATEVYRGGTKGKPVICIETGELYDSAAEASRRLGLTTSAVALSIRRQTKAGGYNWAYLEA